MRVELTFDDGLDDQSLSLLSWQLVNAVPATWFLVGRHSGATRIEALLGAGLLKAIDKGLVHLGNHTWSHVSLGAWHSYEEYYLNPNNLAEDLYRNSVYFYSTTLRDVFDGRLSRAPGRSVWSSQTALKKERNCNEPMRPAQIAASVAASAGYRLIGWHVCDLDSEDPVAVLLFHLHHNPSRPCVVCAHSRNFHRARKTGELLDSLLRLRDRGLIDFAHCHRLEAFSARWRSQNREDSF